MSVFKNEDARTWYTMVRYTDWKGERKQKCKRGFATRKEALAWEREFLQQKQADVEMPFDSFVELYTKDIKPRLKENTWLTKESIICLTLPAEEKARGKNRICIDNSNPQRLTFLVGLYFVLHCIKRNSNANERLS